MIQYFNMSMYFPHKSQKTRPFLTFPSTPCDWPLSKVLGICFPTLHKVHKLCFKVLQGKTFESSSRLETFEDHSKIIRRSFEDHSDLSLLVLSFGFETLKYLRIHSKFIKIQRKVLKLNQHGFV